ncbi:unnamed protein product, partial [Ixodes hexagonus]
VCYDPVLYREVQSFVPRNGDIIEASFPRSGSHWLQQILQLILRKGESAGSYLEFTRRSPYLENRVPEGMESPRLLRTHFSMDRIQLNSRAKYLYVARNPWDCCVSCFHFVREIPACQFQDGSFEDFLDAFLERQSSFGDYFDHVISGYKRRKEPNVFFITYEELQKDIECSVLRLARFLGEDHEQTLKDHHNILQSILEKSSTVFMKNLMRTNPKEMRKALLELPGAPPPSDELTEENGNGSTVVNILRQGTVGDWRKYFSEDGMNKMRAKIEEKTRESDFMTLWGDV